MMLRPKGWAGHSYDLGRMTMRELVIAYVTYPAIQVYAALALVSAAAALVWADELLRPSAAAAAAVLVYPVAWYLLHRFVLHGRLFKSRLTAKLWKRIHFDHHQDPHRLDVLFGALWTTLPTIALITTPVGWAIGGAAGAAAALSAGLAATCFYEFCHCIQHLNYKPRSESLRRIKRLHLAHHFHNETGNYGITNFLADRLFGTFYDTPKAVERSPHVFNLGYDEDQARRYPWVADLTGELPRARPRRYAASGELADTAADPLTSDPLASDPAGVEPRGREARQPAG